ncbi:MAG TPA: YihY/virulence factor BrkB family protein [Acidimicrobiales bacterium]|jgi:YihY family inner membrane protein|nr:YihY/virulence factor BrkB family protein [Acidimicrobiales bacterium]
MSSATLVPETRDLSGDDAWKVLKRVGWGRLAKDSFQRLRVADGFSHARSLAFMMSLVAIEGLIGMVGLASALHKGSVATIIDAALRRAVPGPAGRVLTTAVSQAHHVVAEHQYGGLLFGVIGGVVVATTAMGQLERGLNRIYGVEQDRPSVLKYGLAMIFALSVGTVSAAAFICLAFGRDLFHSTNNAALSTTWAIVRWPLGVGLLAVAVTVLFRWSPRRKQPRLSWLAFGSGISVLLWGVATALLGLFFSTSSSFGSTYGPLAGVVALLLWCLLSSIALFYGAAVAAQLEAVRSGVPEPQDAEKVIDSNPESDRGSVVTS